MLLDVKLDVIGKFEYHLRLRTSLVLVLNGTAKTKLEMLAFLYCGEIVKNSYEGNRVENNLQKLEWNLLPCDEFIRDDIVSRTSGDANEAQ